MPNILPDKASTLLADLQDFLNKHGIKRLDITASGEFIIFVDNADLDSNDANTVLGFRELVNGEATEVYSNLPNKQALMYHFFIAIGANGYDGDFEFRQTTGSKDDILSMRIPENATKQFDGTTPLAAHRAFMNAVTVTAPHQESIPHIGYDHAKHMHYVFGELIHRYIQVLLFSPAKRVMVPQFVTILKEWEDLFGNTVVDADGCFSTHIGGNYDITFGITKD